MDGIFRVDSASAIGGVNLRAMGRAEFDVVDVIAPAVAGLPVARLDFNDVDATWIGLVCASGRA